MKNSAYSRRTLLRWRWRNDQARFSTKAIEAATTVEMIFDVNGLFVACSTKLNRPMSTRKQSAPTVPNFASSWKAARTRASRDRSGLRGSETVVAIGPGYRRVGRSASNPTWRKSARHPAHRGAGAAAQDRGVLRARGRRALRGAPRLHEDVPV